MSFKLITTGILSATLLFASCNNEDSPIIDNGPIKNVGDIDHGISVPATYKFERNNASTVSFSGQTTRIAMAKEIVGYFKVDAGKTVGEVEAAFDHAANAQDFVDAGQLGLNASSKKVKSKVAASKDLFGSDVIAGETVRAMMSTYIANNINDVVPNKDQNASAGNAGVVGTRYVNEKGLEYNQAFAKTLIGGLLVDQVLNNYLGNIYIKDQEDIANNNNQVVEEGKSYTAYEHHYDEAYGYVYGDPSVDAESPVSYESDVFLFKYITRVEGDADFAGIQDQIFKAFKLGRAAVVAQDYEVLDGAIDVLQYQISKVIGVRAVYYLQSGKRYLAAQETADGFHALSEGYGFINSLQFTRNPETDAPYFTATEVAAMIAKLEAGNGFWDLTNGVVLDELSQTIAAKFDFTVAQAGE